MLLLQAYQLNLFWQDIYLHLNIVRLHSKCTHTYTYRYMGNIGHLSPSFCLTFFIIFLFMAWTETLCRCCFPHCFWIVMKALAWVEMHHYTQKWGSTSPYVCGYMTVSLLLMRSYFSLIHSLPRSATHLLSVAHQSHGGKKKWKMM